jgi:hypothetical protein
MVNQDAIRQWVNALESGEYKQGRGRLTRIDERGNLSHCCLGVACEVFREQFNVTTDDHLGVRTYLWRDGDNSESQALVDQHQTRVLLPGVIADHLGVSWAYGDDFSTDVIVAIGPDDQSTLSGLNDGRGYTFPMIAQALRDNFLTDTDTDA